MGGSVAGRGMVGLFAAALCGACGGPAVTPAAPPADATPAGAGSGAPGAPPPAGVWDPASLDPRIAVSLADAPSCAGVGPQDPATEPVRIERPSSTSCGSGD